MQSSAFHRDRSPSPSDFAPLVPTVAPNRVAPNPQLPGWLDRLLTRLAGSDQPRIRYHQRRDGTGYWQVYDPVGGDRHRFAHEADLRTWLDQRYNR
jgi:hypothetical protein